MGDHEIFISSSYSRRDLCGRKRRFLQNTLNGPEVVLALVNSKLSPSPRVEQRMLGQR